MTSYSEPEFRYLADVWSPRSGRSRSEPAPAEAATKLTPGAAVLVTLVVSLGLWAAIWQAVSSLAATWPG